MSEFYRRWLFNFWVMLLCATAALMLAAATVALFFWIGTWAIPVVGVGILLMVSALISYDEVASHPHH